MAKPLISTDKDTEFRVSSYGFLNTRYIAFLDKTSRINKHLDAQIKKLLKKNSRVFDPLYKTFLKCKSPEELNKLKPKDLPENKDFQYLLTRILQYSDLYGRYTALGAESSSSSNSLEHSKFKIQNSKFDLSIDYDMQYHEAAEWFSNLKVIYAPDFYDELRNNAGYSWTISYITQAETLNKCQKYITAALQGKTKIDPQEMKQAIADFAVSNGDAPLTPWHLDTIIRTNLQSAYSKGRYIQQRNSDNPYWQYLATLDGRETELCRSLDGKVFRKTDAFWGNYYPPNHFNCRSTVVTLDEETLKEEGLQVEKSGTKFLKQFRKQNPDIAKRLYPGTGFAVHPRRGLAQWLIKKANQLKVKIKKKATPEFKSIKEAAEYIKSTHSLDDIIYNKCKSLIIMQEVASALDKLQKYNFNLSKIEFVNINSNTLASHETKIYINGDKSFSLKINVHGLNKKSLSEINEDIELAANMKWSVPESYFHIIAHEIGHNLTYNFIDSDKYDFLNEKPEKDLPRISTYALTSNAEYIAELFVYYLQGKTLNKKQKGLLKDYLGL